MKKKNKSEVFTVFNFIDRDAKETTFEKCSIVVGTIDKCELCYPISKDVFKKEVKVGDKFLLNELK